MCEHHLLHIEYNASIHQSALIMTGRIDKATVHEKIIWEENNQPSRQGEEVGESHKTPVQVGHGIARGLW